MDARQPTPVPPEQGFALARHVCGILGHAKSGPTLSDEGAHPYGESSQKTTGLSMLCISLCSSSTVKLGAVGVCVLRHGLAGPQSVFPPEFSIEA